VKDARRSGHALDRPVLFRVPEVLDRREQSGYFFVGGHMLVGLGWVVNFVLRQLRAVNEAVPGTPRVEVFGADAIMVERHASLALIDAPTGVAVHVALTEVMEGHAFIFGPADKLGELDAVIADGFCGEGRLFVEEELLESLTPCDIGYGRQLREHLWHLLRISVVRFAVPDSGYQ
jgi:hypothetical protein